MVKLISRNAFLIALQLSILSLILQPVAAIRAANPNDDQRPGAPGSLRLAVSSPNGGSQPTPIGLLDPNDFIYQGAFRLPSEIGGNSRFGYGGRQIAFNPNGDLGGDADGYPGSLYISGHSHHQLVAEVSIPVPVISPTKNAAELPVAGALQPFGDITGGLMQSNQYTNTLGGMLFFDDGGGMKVYWSVYKYYNVAADVFPTHGYSDPTLAAGQQNAQGLWYLGNYNPNRTAGYIFDVPSSFANQHLGGKRLISGLMGVAGQAASSLGPAMFAYAPWQHSPQPPEPGAHLDTVPLVYFPPDHMAPDFKFCDQWRGGAWSVSGDKQAVLIVGRKSLGENYYGPGRPGDCSQAKGYHCAPYEPQILFYNPDDLAAVSRGERQPWSVVPYRTWSPKEYLFPSCDGGLKGVTFDQKHQILYLIQYGADRVTSKYEPYPLIHVFRVSESK